MDPELPSQQSWGSALVQTAPFLGPCTTSHVPFLQAPLQVVQLGTYLGSSIAQKAQIHLNVLSQKSVRTLEPLMDSMANKDKQIT